MTINKFISLSVILFSLMNGEDVSGHQVITVDQDTLTLANVINKEQPTMLYFWATWSPTCKKETPKMIKLAKEFPGIQFIPLAYTEPAETVKRFLLKKDYDLNTYIDYSGVVFNKFGVRSTPTLVIFDKKNRIIFNGYKSTRFYKKLLKKLSS